MEADFNFANKLFFGRRMLHWAEDHNEVPIECFGSRNGHKAIDVAINRCLFLDIARLKRRPSTLTSADANCCYDRMAHSIASLATQRLALALETITCLLLTIQFMRFFLRTAFGDSDNHYGGP